MEIFYDASIYRECLNLFSLGGDNEGKRLLHHTPPAEPLGERFSPYSEFYTSLRSIIPHLPFRILFSAFSILYTGTA